MTISVLYGFNNLTTEQVASQYHADALKVANSHGVPSMGYFGISAGSSARTIQVLGGRAVVAGTLVSSNATETVTLDAGGSSARTDLVVLRVTWGVGAVLAVKKGTSTVPPSLTQLPGEVWEMPLARVTVPASHNAVFTGSHIQQCRPQPAWPKFRTTETFSSANVDFGNPSVLISTLSHIDPGWPYILRVNATMAFSGTQQAGLRGTLIARVGSTSQTDATELIRSYTDYYPGEARIDASTEPRTGPCHVGLYVAPAGTGDNVISNPNSLSNNFEIHLIPSL